MEMSLSKFTWDKEKGVIFADASELGCEVGEIPGKQVWVDSCDYGFRVVGKKEVYTFLLDEDKLEDGLWEYTPYEKSCPIEKLQIFND